MCTLERTLAVRLLISIAIIMPDFLASGNSCLDGKQFMQDRSSLPAEVNTSLSVELGSSCVLCCPPVLLTNVDLRTWKIMLRDQPFCTKAYRRETNESTDTNCTDERVTWASRPDLSPHLQINAVAVAHDGYYICEIVSPTGNFQHGYQLQVLVRPEANMFLSKNKTLVCEAVAGRPAAQISWTPKGRCVTKEEKNSNGTVTVRSTCRYSDSNVSTVTCLVSHVTGNRSLSEVLPSGATTSGSAASSLLIILYVKLSVLMVVLVIVGFASSQKINACSKV
uniref:Ig-like domain-containing protein n=1 Tax=Chinchilla lanigera TaxID=34839 RepID=A0A8C2VBY0_CHILA